MIEFFVYLLGFIMAVIFIFLLYQIDKPDRTCKNCNFAKKGTCIGKHWSYWCAVREIFVDHNQTCNVFEFSIIQEK